VCLHADGMSWYSRHVSHTVIVDLTPLGTPTRMRGIGRYLKTLALGLSRMRATDVTGLRLLALTRLDLMGRYRVTDDFARAPDQVGPPSPTSLDRYRWAFARRLAIWSVARSVGADLIHFGDPNVTPIGLSFIGCRRIVTCHDLIPLQFPGVYLGARDGYGLVGKALIRRRFRSADRVLAISQATRGDLTRLLGLAEDRIMVVYNGLDLASFTSQRCEDDEATLARYGLKARGYVLYVGDTNWRKNVDGMLAAMGRVHGLGCKLDLVFAGALDVEKVKAIRAKAARHGIARSVKLVGFVTDGDLQVLYRHAAAHLFISRAEGFGYTVVEAMASGCPVVTTRCGSLGEVAGEAGVLVEPDDHDGVAEAIRRLLLDEGFRAEHVARGLVRARQFSCEEQARATVRAYRTTLAADGPGGGEQAQTPSSRR